MHQYKVEYFQPTDGTSGQQLALKVQELLDARARSGWRLVNMVSLAGIEGVRAGNSEPRLLCVFESVEETPTEPLTAHKAPKAVAEFVCSDCGGDITEDTKVCPHCGAPIEDGQN